MSRKKILLILAVLVLCSVSTMVLFSLDSSKESTDKESTEQLLIEGTPKEMLSSSSGDRENKEHIDSKEEDVVKPQPTIPPSLLSRGKIIYSAIQKRYKFPIDVGETAFYHINNSSNVNINIPTQEWKRLNKQEQVCLTYYAESLIPIVKAEPEKYANAWIRYAKWESNQFSGIINGIEHLCDDCWCVVYGKLVRENGIYDMIEDDRICGSTAASFRGK